MGLHRQGFFIRDEPQCAKEGWALRPRGLGCIVVTRLGPYRISVRVSSSRIALGIDSGCTVGCTWMGDVGRKSEE